jgi:hypothetical protein
MARTSGGTAEAARTLVPLPDPAPEAKDPIYMSFPSPPDEEALAEAASYLETLEARKQIARDPGRAAPGTTHQLEVDEAGRKRLVRRRFSAG